MTLLSRKSPLRRLPGLALKLVAGMVLALPLACLHVGAEASRSEVVIAGALLECPVGSLGCPCTAGGGCDPGLVCMSGYCDYGDAGEGEVYEFEDDVLMLEAPAAMPESKRSAPAKARSRVEFRKRLAPDSIDMPDAAAPAAAPRPEPTPVDVTGTGAGTSSEPGDDASEEPDDGRLVIYTAGLDVAVYELDAAMEIAESIPARFGGWIESRYDYQITLRVPAERLFETIELLSELGLVLGKSLRADDVTAEYTDLASRILVLEQLVEQLELLLKQAKTVEEALKIRIELDRVRLELESARTRMRALSEMIDFSTLTLSLSQRGDRDVLPSSNDPFPWVDDLGVETTEYR